MKYIQFLWIILAGFISFSPTLFAQTENKITVPSSVQKNCLLTQSGTIDFCPEYRAQVRDLNTKLFQQRTDAEIKGQITLYDFINTSIAWLRSESELQKKAELSWPSLFLLEYEEYITNLFTQYFNTNTNKPNLVKNFFTTTYFNQDQSWLWITSLHLFNNIIPLHYDTKAILQLSVRNFSPNQISNIEDIYCFSTINDQDYMYPMKIQQTFKENSITNLVLELKVWISPLFEKIGQKDIACTLVYTQFNETKYTNRGKISFVMTE